MKYTPDRITHLQPNQIFVFGSNLSGMHLGGAARLALKWGAINGKHIGLYGQTYAIPTVGHHARGTLSIEEITPFVQRLIEDAKSHPDKEFLVTEIGCGIAGLTPEEVAPLFKEALELENVVLPRRFIQLLSK